MRNLGILFLGLGLGLAACGAVDNFSDAGPGSDGHSIDAEVTVGTANVTTYNNCCTGTPHTPVAGIDVVVLAPDGTQRDLQVTDGSGNATVNVHTGDSVTVIYRDLVNQVTVDTVAAVKPNDHLQFGTAFQPSVTTTPTGTITANFPDIGANYYYVYAACTQGYAGTGGTSATLTFDSSCPATTSLFFLAYDVNNNIIEQGRIDNQSTSAVSTVTLQNWQQPSGLTMSASGVPSDVVNVRLQVADYVGPNYSISSQYSAAPVNGALTSTVPFLPLPNGAKSLVVFDRDPTLGQFGEQGDFGSLPANSVQFAVNNPTLLPWLGTTSIDVATETITQPTDGPAGGNVELFNANWSRVINGNTVNFAWLIIAPPDTGTTFVLPALTGNDSDVLPIAADSVFMQAFLEDWTSIANYDGIRAQPLWQALPFGTSFPTGLDIALSPNGQGARARGFPGIHATPGRTMAR